MQTLNLSPNTAIAERNAAAKDFVLGLALVSVGAAAFIVIQSVKDPGMAGAGALNFASVPKICAILLVLLSGVYATGAVVRLVIASRALTNWREGFTLSRPSMNFWRQVGTIVFLIAYVIALQTLPFIFATAGFLAVMFLLYGQRSPLRVLLLALLGSATLTGLFVFVLRLPI